MLSDLFDKLLDVLSLSVVEVEDVDTLLLSLFVVVVSSSTFCCLLLTKVVLDWVFDMLLFWLSTLFNVVLGSSVFNFCVFETWALSLWVGCVSVVTWFEFILLLDSADVTNLVESVEVVEVVATSLLLCFVLSDW